MVLMLELTRVFVSYLVFVVDQSKRVEISLIVLAVFISPILAWLIRRLFGLSRMTHGSAIVLAALAILLQFIETPETRIVIGGLGIVCWGWITVGMLCARRTAIVAGLGLGLALDVLVRINFQLIDLPWMPDVPSLIATVVLAAGLVFAVATMGTVAVSAQSGFRAALPLLAIGPGIAMFHLMAGNIALAEVWTDYSVPNAAAQYSFAFLAAMLLIWTRFSRMGPDSEEDRPKPRYFVIDMVLGSLGLVLFWGGFGLEEVGLFIVTITSVSLLSIALLPSEPEQKTGASVLPVAVFLAASMVIQFVLLFLYYTATGSTIMVAAAWLILLAGAGLNTYRLSRVEPIFEWLSSKQMRLPYAALLLVIIGTSVVQAFLWSEEDAETPTGNDITVMTYNIQSGFSLDNYWDLEATAQTIEAEDPDILILQEVSRGWLVTTYNDQMLWLSKRLELPFVWGPASNDDLWGNAILSKWPVTNEQVFKYASTQNLDRSLVAAEIATPGRPVWVIGTHLDNPEDAAAVRFEQVDQLLEFWGDRSSTIIAGDFNADPSDPVIAELHNAGLIDTGADFDPSIATSYTGFRIDYIFVTPDLTVLDAFVPDSDASDHRPVVAVLSLQE